MTELNCPELSVAGHVGLKNRLRSIERQADLRVKKYFIPLRPCWSGLGIYIHTYTYIFHYIHGLVCAFPLGFIKKE